MQNEKRIILRWMQCQLMNFLINILRDKSIPNFTATFQLSFIISHVIAVPFRFCLDWVAAF